MSWLRKIFTENVGLKVLSLLLAASLWVASGSDPLTETTARVPVEFTHVPPHLELIAEPSVVQLRIQGPSRAVRRATPADFSVRVDLAAVSGPAARTFSLTPHQIVTPSFLKVVEVRPPQIRVVMEPTLVREIPVQPQFSGALPPRYHLKSVRVQPSKVTIAGPRSHVEAVVMAWTDPLDLNLLSSGNPLVTTVSFADPLIRLLHPPAVQVTVELEKTN